MNVQLDPGKYVVAVSGGVDSMVLLDVLRQLPGVTLVVAHFDHGIRPDSAKDRQLVEVTANQHGLPFIYEAGHLGASASEATAREARYAFLHKVKEAQHAQAIVTAHHQDDVLETAVLNLLRGTGRKGLSSLRSTNDMVRPLLHLTKQALLDYATTHHITWHEDSTNQDQRYLRNYVRHTLLPGLGEPAKAQLLQHIANVRELNDELDHLLMNALHTQAAPDTLDRHWFIMLPHAVACEVMAAWLRNNQIRSFDKKLINQLVIAAKVALPGKSKDITGRFVLRIGKGVVQITPAPFRKNSGGHV
jgi:tRNA(Ile)-lysidine synthase